MTRRRAPVVSDDDGSVSDDDRIDRRPTRRRHHLISHDTPPRRRPTRLVSIAPTREPFAHSRDYINKCRTTGDTCPTDRPPRDLNVGQLGTPVRPTARRAIHPSRTTSPHSSLSPTSSPPRPRGRRSRAWWIGTLRVVGRARASRLGANRVRGFIRASVRARVCVRSRTARARKGEDALTRRTNGDEAVAR